MPAPINYMGMIEKPDIAGRFARGYKIGEMLGQGVADEKYKNDLIEAYKDPKREKFIELQAMYPDKAANTKAIADSLESTQKDAIFRGGIEISNAMRTGNADVAKEKLKTAIEANKNSGYDTSEYERIYNILDSGNTNGAIFAADLFLSGFDPKKYEEVHKAREAQAASEKTSAEAETEKVKSKYAEQLERLGIQEKQSNINNVSSQIADRSARLKIDQDNAAQYVAEKQASIAKLNADVPESTRKLINDAAVTAGTAKLSADNFNNLAQRMESADITAEGKFATASEWLKDAVGGQDQISQLRNEFIRLRNADAVKALPPGPATDRDIALFMKGIPEETADKTVIVSYLRGAAKAQDLLSSVENAKADWLAQNNGSLQRAKDQFRVGDYESKKGETWTDFSKRVAQDVNKRYTAKQETLFPGAKAPTQDQRLLNMMPGAGAGAPTGGVALPAGFTLLSVKK